MEIAQASLSESRLYHQRGNWASLTMGATHWTGRDEPSNFVNRIINIAVILALVSNTAFILPLYKIKPFCLSEAF
jgi:hypothetical protein